MTIYKFKLQFGGHTGLNAVGVETTWAQGDIITTTQDLRVLNAGEVNPKSCKFLLINVVENSDGEQN